MNASDIAAMLTKARKTGPGRWVACCPAHEDRSPSMTIRELDDGRILMHCFTGCSIESILGALGIQFEDLFPEKLGDHFPREKIPFPASDVLQAVKKEALIVAIGAAASVHRELSLEDKERLMLASERIQRAYR